MVRKMEKQYYDTPLWDSSLPEEVRLDYLLRELALEEKFACLGTGCPAVERLGIPAFSVGGEGAHGVQARNDQKYDSGEPLSTTILPNPIGMSATWDEALIKEAGEMVGKEARGLYQSGKHKSLSLWAPTVDMERDPRWGRTEEGYGEDPYLTGKMAGAYVDGLQGEDAFYLRCAATLKHYYANNVEQGRTYCSSTVDLRNKHEYYLAPFRRLIQEHHAEGLMTAYNEVNGVPCMLLKDDIGLAKQWGVGHVVCDGGDVSQTVTIHKYFSRHSETIAAGLDAEVDCFTDDIAMVSVAAKEAYEHHMITEKQIDLALRNHFRVMLRLGLFEREGKNPYSGIGMEAVGTKENHALARRVTAESVVLLKNDGILPLSTEKMTEKKERLAVIGPLSNVWHQDWYAGNPPYAVTPLEGIRNVFAQSEAEDALSVVQLQIKDETGRYLGILPDGETIGAVAREQAQSFQITFWEEDRVTLRAENGLLLTTEDDTSIGQEGRVCAKKETAFGWFVREIFYLREDGNLQTWDETELMITEDGVLKKQEQMAQASQANDGKKLFVEMVIQKDGIAQAQEAAKAADTVLLFLGSHPMITCKEEIDRKDIALPPYQEKLLRSVCMVNQRVVLVLVSSVPYDISWAKEHTAGIMVCATGSMELGNGLADIIFGKESPAGRLNMTWYASTENLPELTDYDIIQGRRTYQYYEGEVLYPFGHGLTYSTIAYHDLEVQQTADSHLQVKLSVTNTGKRQTDEVVQIYYHKPDSAVKRARRTLVAFERVKALQPGETREAAFDISPDELKYFDVIAEEMLLETGEYRIQAGCSSAQILLEKSIFLQGTKRGFRDGFTINKAECFDTAKNHVLQSGHLGYTAVCTRNETDRIELCYERVYLEKKAEGLWIDFWKEYPCHIEIQVNGNAAGEADTVGAVPAESRRAEEGEADGAGAFEAHQNWLTQRREIGFTELFVPLGAVPVQEPFTLTIQWQGKGKLCTYQFREQ